MLSSSFLSRSAVGRMMPSLVSANAVRPAAVPAANLVQSRSILFIKETPKEDRKAVRRFIESSNRMGCEAYPGYRKERLPKSKARVMADQHRTAKMANEKVHSTLLFIDLKRRDRYR